MWAETLLSILSLLIRLLMLVNSSSDNTSVSSNLLSQAWIKERKNSDRFYYVKWYEYQVMLHHSGRVFNFCRQLMKHGNTKIKASTKLSQLGSVMLVLLGGWTKNYSNVWASWGFFCGIDDRLTGSVSSVLSWGTCPISLFTLMFLCLCLILS